MPQFIFASENFQNDPTPNHPATCASRRPRRNPVLRRAEAVLAREQYGMIFFSSIYPFSAKSGTQHNNCDEYAECSISGRLCAVHSLPLCRGMRVAAKLYISRLLRCL